MKFIQGHDRNQTYFSPISLEQCIAPDNEVRVIDLFVDSLPLKNLDLVWVLLKTVARIASCRFKPSIFSDKIADGFYGRLNRLMFSHSLIKNLSF